jgi:hypothetical protein
MSMRVICLSIGHSFWVSNVGTGRLVRRPQEIYAYHLNSTPRPHQGLRVLRKSEKSYATIQIAAAESNI